jgi:hypothetical protein
MIKFINKNLLLKKKNAFQTHVLDRVYKVYCLAEIRGTNRTSLTSRYNLENRINKFK